MRWSRSRSRYSAERRCRRRRSLELCQYRRWCCHFLALELAFSVLFLVEPPSSVFSTTVEPRSALHPEQPESGLHNIALSTAATKIFDEVASNLAFNWASWQGGELVNRSGGVLALVSLAIAVQLLQSFFSCRAAIDLFEGIFICLLFHFIFSGVRGLLLNGRNWNCHALQVFWG